MAIPEQFIDDLVSRSDIADVVRTGNALKIVFDSLDQAVPGNCHVALMRHMNRECFHSVASINRKVLCIHSIS